ncbi:hypothetical protein [Kitasatospora purpeofusca]|uniref:hypothetical protein n=1 Tax=Kitasatospora purpeofusca TaxID=67352 RepID=UPI0036757DCD
MAGAVARYTISRTPAGELPGVFAEFRRVPAPGAPLLLAFQADDDVLRLDRPFGRPVILDFRRGRPERIEAPAGAAGPKVATRLVASRNPTSGPRRRTCWPTGRRNGRRGGPREARVCPEEAPGARLRPGSPVPARPSGGVPRDRGPGMP